MAALAAIKEDGVSTYGFSLQYEVMLRKQTIGLLNKRKVLAPGFYPHLTTASQKGFTRQIYRVFT